MSTLFYLCELNAIDWLIDWKSRWKKEGARPLTDPASTFSVCDHNIINHLQGGPIKVSQVIFAITLSTVIQFS